MSLNWAATRESVNDVSVKGPVQIHLGSIFAGEWTHCTLSEIYLGFGDAQWLW